MKFYDPVTRENALEWYADLPPHLRKRIDDSRQKFKGGRECSKSECPEVYDAVSKELGSRPLRPADPADPLDGHTQKQIIQFENHKKWGARYDELLLIKLITENASDIQRERKALNEAMGLNVDAADLPPQSDGLDPTQAATVRWLQLSGEMPIEFLARTFRSEDAKMNDRLSAARTLMDFAHRKIPSKSEVDTNIVSTPKLDPKILKALNTKELELLEKLLGKLDG